jgi:molybdopterin-guanine dinucleotide biosynthesis protein A
VCAEVVVVLSPEAPEPDLPGDVSVRVARDAAPGEGPLAGVAAGLGAVRADLALIGAGDMPDLQERVLLAMILAARRPAAGAVALGDGGSFRPLPCVVRSRAAAAAAGALLASGRRRLLDLLDAVGVEVIAETVWVALDPQRRTLLDVDEPRDLVR